MNRQPVFLIIALLLFASISSVALRIQEVEAAGTIYIRADGNIEPPTAPISTLDNFTYILTGNITSDFDGIRIERDNIVLDGAGYTVKGAGQGTGIDLLNRKNVTIQNVHAETFLYGIHLYGSSNSSLLGNQMRFNLYGIMLTDSSDNTISGSDTRNNDWGIQLYWSPNTTLRSNNMSSNNYNFAVYGGYFWTYIQDVDVSNTVNGKPVYYLMNTQSPTVSSDAGYVALINCTAAELKNMNLTENGQGVLLAYTRDSTVTENSLIGNWEGIYLYESTNNTISGNSIVSGNTGILIDNFSENNSVSGNNVTDGYSGIYLLNHSGHNIISDNNVTGCVGSGFSINLSEYNSIYANNATNNRDGIYLDGSPNNILINNTANGNTQSGIYLWESGNNTLGNNSLTGNWIDFMVNSEYLSDFYQNIDSSNLVNGKPVYYIVDLENIVIAQEDYPDIGYMGLVNGDSVVIENVGLQSVEGLELIYSHNCSVKNANMENCTFGVGLLNSSNNTVANVTVNNGYAGILYLNSINNSLFENTFSGNRYGIWSINSNGNSIYHNSFIDNSQQVSSEQSANVWDDGYPSGGNYWNDYNGTDENHDGIGDSQYVIDANNIDHYPLMVQYVIPEFPTFIIPPLFFVATLLAVTVYRRKHAQSE